MTKRGPKEIPQINQFWAKNQHFGAKLALEFLLKAQKLDWLTPTSSFNLCRQNLTQLFAGCTKKCHQYYFLKTFCPFGWSSICLFVVCLFLFLFCLFVCLFFVCFFSGTKEESRRQKQKGKERTRNRKRERKRNKGRKGGKVYENKGVHKCCCCTIPGLNNLRRFMRNETK